MKDRVYDPDLIEKQIAEITVEEFGRLIARAIKETPSSNYWFLVSKVIESKTGWDGEHAQVEALVERLSK
jgi:hypothetical protein